MKRSPRNVTGALILYELRTRHEQVLVLDAGSFRIRVSKLYRTGGHIQCGGVVETITLDQRDDGLTSERAARRSG